MYIFVLDLSFTGTSKYKFTVGTDVGVPTEMRPFRELVH